LISHDRRGKERGMRKLIERFVKGRKFRDKYIIAIIYDNQNGELLKKFNSKGVEMEIKQQDKLRKLKHQ